MKWKRLFGAANKAQLFRHVTALWLLVKDPRAPLAPKVVAVLVLAYALSPIDLIPDFIPVLGLLDDLILIPLGVALAVRLVPGPLWLEYLERADAFKGRLPKWVAGAVLVFFVWAAAGGGLAWWFLAGPGSA
ncbi:MAG: DUF1232 domain-containing protein [Pseudomonadota bacterium]